MIWEFLIETSEKHSILTMGSSWQIPEQSKSLDVVLIDYTKASESMSWNGNPKASGIGEGSVLATTHQQKRRWKHHEGHVRWLLVTLPLHCNFASIICKAETHWEMLISDKRRKPTSYLLNTTTWNYTVRRRQKLISQLKLHFFLEGNNNFM